MSLQELVEVHLYCKNMQLSGSKNSWLTFCIRDTKYRIGREDLNTMIISTRDFYDQMLLVNLVNLKLVDGV